MSYYQLISLKLQMGIDPDASIDHKTLLEMWKTHQYGKTLAAKPGRLRNQRATPEAKVHFPPQDVAGI